MVEVVDVTVVVEDTVEVVEVTVEVVVVTPVVVNVVVVVGAGVVVGGKTSVVQVPVGPHPSSHVQTSTQLIVAHCACLTAGSRIRWNGLRGYHA